MIEIIFTVVTELVAEIRQRLEKHCVSGSGILKYVGVSQFSYNEWEKRTFSVIEKHRGEMKKSKRFTRIFIRRLSI